MRELALGVRLTLAGGRTGLLRTALTAVGVALGVAALLIAASLPAIQSARNERSQARVPVPAEGQTTQSTVLVGDVTTRFRNRDIQGRMLEPSGPGVPLPPGLERMPRPGESFVSPALGRLLATRAGRALLGPRIPGRIVGEIGPAGLLGPSELGFYAGARGLVEGGPVVRVSHFGVSADSVGLGPILALLTVIALVALLLPVGVLVAAAVRTGGEERDRRLAALRLVGADHGMARRIAAGESLVAAVAGVVLGTLAFLAVRGYAEQITLFDLSVYGGDVRPSLLLAALVVLGVPAAAVIVTLVALRRVVVEPLGVIRRAEPARRRLWWRLLLPAAGLLALAPAAGQRADQISQLRIAVGVIALLVGVAALLPWVVERVVARLGGGRVAWQLAVRRLQLDPGGPARAVSGITVAVAGAIALQMVFAGAQAQFETDTGADVKRATLSTTLAAGVPAGEVTARLTGVAGVRSAIALTQYEIGRDPQLPEAELYVAPCAILRELVVTGRCGGADVFVSGDAPDAGERVAFGPRRSWAVPAGAQTVAPRLDPAGGTRAGVFATPAAVRGAGLPSAGVLAYVRTDPRHPDTVEHVRNAVAALDPLASVMELERIRTASEFGSLRRALFAGASIVIGLIGLSLLITALEQLRERRRLLAVLVAFGTRRSTLSWSVLWQSAVPVALGLAIAALTGVGLGALLLRVLGVGVEIAWADVAAMAAVGAAVVLAVTAASLPVLWRTMRPDGLRTE